MTTNPYDSTGRRHLAIAADRLDRQGWTFDNLRVSEIIERIDEDDNELFARLLDATRAGDQHAGTVALYAVLPRLLTSVRATTGRTCRTRALDETLGFAWIVITEPGNPSPGTAASTSSSAESGSGPGAASTPTASTDPTSPNERSPTRPNCSTDSATPRAKTSTRPATRSCAASRSNASAAPSTKRSRTVPSKRTTGPPSSTPESWASPHTASTAANPAPGPPSGEPSTASEPSLTSMRSSMTEEVPTACGAGPAPLIFTWRLAGVR
ncbi:MAG: hypothetical protein R2715_24525 [Ilumatobacteraceae bacterium]